jgi:cytochrome c oxidase cbb3-type subunit I/II
MKDDNFDTSLMERKINAMRTLGVPYEEGYEKIAVKEMRIQALKVATEIVNNYPPELKKNINIEAEINKLKTKEVVAMIAYLQRLGTDIKTKPAALPIVEPIDSTSIKDTIVSPK